MVCTENSMYSKKRAIKYFVSGLLRSERESFHQIGESCGKINKNHFYIINLSTVL